MNSCRVFRDRTVDAIVRTFWTGVPVAKFYSHTAKRLDS